MDRRRKRAVAIGAVAALAVAGGGVAYAAATATNPRDAVLRDAAQRLNVSPDQLRAALQGAFTDQLDQAVKDGKLTQQQADRIEQRIRDGGVPLGGPGGPGFGHGPMGGHGPFGAGIDAAATYLGLTRAALDRQLRGGKTLAQVAGAQGKSLSGLESALVDATRSALDRAVTNGRLTSVQRDDIVRGLQQHVADLVNGAGPRMGFRRGGGPGGPGGAGGPGSPPPWGGPPGGPGNP